MTVKAKPSTRPRKVGFALAGEAATKGTETAKTKNKETAKKRPTTAAKKEKSVPKRPTQTPVGIVTPSTLRKGAAKRKAAATASSTSKNKSKSKTKTVAAGPAKSAASNKGIEFRFLPSEFQEPQLLQYCSQFGSAVDGCVCLRHKKTNSSRGIAIVKFKDPSVIPQVMEESNGMLLGGRTVRCKPVYLKRSLPALKMSLRRYSADVKRRTRGPSIRQFVNSKLYPTADDASVGSTPLGIVGALKKYSEKEKAHNKFLQRLGIDYSFNGFQQQLAKLPPGLKKSRAQMKKIRAAAKANPSSLPEKKLAKRTRKTAPKK